MFITTTLTRVSSYSPSPQAVPLPIKALYYNNAPYRTPYQSSLHILHTVLPPPPPEPLPESPGLGVYFGAFSSPTSLSPVVLMSPP